MKNFNDVENVVLRTWNRCAIMSNLKQDKGEDAVVKYASQFSKGDIALAYTMLSLIKTRGYENVKMAVNKSIGGDSIVH
jgi:hypothetical protein